MAVSQLDYAACTIYARRGDEVYIADQHGVKHLGVVTAVCLAVNDNYKVFEVDTGDTLRVSRFVWPKEL